MTGDISAEKKSENAPARHRLESELLILEADRKRFKRHFDELSMEIKRLENDLKRQELLLGEKKAAKEKLERDVLYAEGEIAHTKKQLNTLG